MVYPSNHSGPHIGGESCDEIAFSRPLNRRYVTSATLLRISAAYFLCISGGHFLKPLKRKNVGIKNAWHSPRGHFIQDRKMIEFYVNRIYDVSHRYDLENGG